MAFKKIAEKTFDNYKLMFYSLLRANPLVDRKQLAEKIDYVLDSGVSQICHLMEWDYDKNFDIIYDFIVYKSAEFQDLEVEVVCAPLITKLRYDGIEHVEINKQGE